MRKKYLKEFVLLQNSIRQNKNELTPKSFYLSLLRWAIGLKDTKDISIFKLYQDFIFYFEELNTNNYLFESLWYDFDELVEVDFLKKHADNLDSVVPTVGEILWEIIAFKTDRPCKITDVHNLRLLTNQNKDTVYFCCDVCGYTEDINKVQVKVDTILYPASIDQIFKYKIKPEKPVSRGLQSGL